MTRTAAFIVLALLTVSASGAAAQKEGRSLLQTSTPPPPPPPPPPSSAPAPGPTAVPSTPVVTAALPPQAVAPASSTIQPLPVTTAETPTSASASAAAIAAAASGDSSPAPAPVATPPTSAQSPSTPVAPAPSPIPLVVDRSAPSPAPLAEAPVQVIPVIPLATASAGAAASAGAGIAPGPGVVVSNANSAASAQSTTPASIASATAAATAIAIARDGTPGAPGAPGAVVYLPGPPGAPGTPGTPGSATATATAVAIVEGTTTVNGERTAGVGVLTNASAPSLAVLAQQTPVPSSPPPPSAVPSPPPPPPAQCLVEPQCRLYVEDMQCCSTNGLVTDKTTAFLWILCSHPVAIPQGCLSISGPQNVTEYPVFNGAGANYNYRSIINWQSDLPNGQAYSGPVSLDLQSARTEDPTCALNLQTPCIYDGSTYTSVATVKTLNFTTLPLSQFFPDYVGCPASNLDSLDSWAWTDITPGSSQCLEQQTSFLPPSFFQGGWIFYNGGYQIDCNTTATSASYQQLLQANATVSASSAAATNSGRRLF